MREAEQPRRVRKSAHVVELAEDAQRVFGHGLRLGERAGRIGAERDIRVHDLGVRADAVVTDPLRLGYRLREDRLGALELACDDECRAEIHCERQPLRVVLGEQGSRPQEQSSGRVHVARKRPPACRRKVPGCARAQLGGCFVERSELGAGEIRVLEVMAQKLVVLRRALAGLAREPVGEPLVQLGALCFRQRAVRGVANEDVRETERILAREHRRFVGCDQTLADK